MIEQYCGTPKEESILALLLYVGAEGRWPYLQGLITHSLKLRRGIEKAETVLIRLICFDVRLSGLP